MNTIYLNATSKKVAKKLPHVGRQLNITLLALQFVTRCHR